MKFTLFPFLLASLALTDKVPFERLNKDDSVSPSCRALNPPLTSPQLLLVIDLQEGLYTLARDFDATLYRDSMIAHSALGQVFDLPVILTTSAQTGPNGPLPQEILDMYPSAPLIKRLGEVDAWDNADFRAAVRAANKTQIIMAGIVTDVCTTFLALSLRAEGYSVWANVEASGTTTGLIRDVSNDRMARAGVNVVSLFSIVCDLMRDWRSTPGATELFPWLDRYLPAYGYLARGHRAAILNGTVLSGEDRLPT
jgi:nicotinamidase-related amidase